MRSLTITIVPIVAWMIFLRSSGLSFYKGNGLTFPCKKARLVIALYAAYRALTFLTSGGSKHSHLSPKLTVRSRNGCNLPPTFISARDFALMFLRPSKIIIIETSRGTMFFG